MVTRLEMLEANDARRAELARDLDERRHRALLEGEPPAWRVPEPL
jgi:hypothetical protein